MLQILFIVFVLSSVTLLVVEVIKVVAIYTWKPTKSHSTSHPISIIVAAHNEYENLQNLIPKLCNQSYHNFEVWIALDRCSDKSRELLIDFQQQFTQLKYLEIKQKPKDAHPKKYALEQAIHQASHEWLVFTDADCIPGSDWLTSLSRQQQSHREIVLGASPYYKEPGLLNVFIQYETFLTSLSYLSAVIGKQPFMAVGRNLSYRKPLFIQGQGFGRYKRITGGDDDLFLQQHATKANVAVALGKLANVYSIPKKSWSAYLRQKIRHLSVGKYYRRSFQVQHVLFLSLTAAQWATFIFLTVLRYNIAAILVVLASVTVLKTLSHHLAGRKMGFGYSYFLMLPLEVMHTVLIPVIGGLAFFRKQVKWN
ncbi:MAG: glycosyltransferase [Cyclobacteriaceae bacterium]|nr:glycosyltransferase [Cyclobacteriaceae bacterium HetDA_MAG_MS6]